MGMPKTFKRKFLPEEYLFRYYYEKMGKAGSLAKLSVHLSKITEHPETGEVFSGINPNTGMPFSAQAIQQAMWRWALADENLKTSHDIYAKFMIDEYGEYLSDEKWAVIVNAQAKLCLKTAYARFLRRHPEFVIE